MGDKSGIGWTNATWGPVVGCHKVSDGCSLCYAEGEVERWHAAGSPAFPEHFDKVVLRPQFLDRPLHWTRPRMIFVNSMSDLFHTEIPASYVAQVYAVMARCPQHIFQILTKRHGPMRSLLNSPAWTDLLAAAYKEHDVTDVDPERPLDNIWGGVSVENQDVAKMRLDALMDSPFALRWASAEPLLSGLDLRPWLSDVDDEGERICQDHGVRDCRQRSGCMGLDWVVVGGESSRTPGLARRMDPDWMRSLRDQCEVAGVPMFAKQTGHVLAREWGLKGKGDHPDDWPEQFPKEYPRAL